MLCPQVHLESGGVDILNIIECGLWDSAWQRQIGLCRKCKTNGSSSVRMLLLAGWKSRFRDENIPLKCCCLKGTTYSIFFSLCFCITYKV